MIIPYLTAPEIPLSKVMKLLSLSVFVLLVSASCAKASECLGEGKECLTGAFDNFDGVLTVKDADSLAALNPKGLVYGMVLKPSVEVINHVLADGLLDSNAFDVYGRSSLMYALGSMDFEAADALIANGADVNAFSYSPALVIAAVKGNIEAVKYLLDHGANINLIGTSGFTVLGAAARSSKPELVQFLLGLGCDINQRDQSDGSTPLILAALEAYNLETVKMLVENGADMSIKDDYENTAVHAATQSWESENLEYLLENGGRKYIHLTNKKGNNVFDLCDSNYCCNREKKLAALKKCGV